MTAQVEPATSPDDGPSRTGTLRRAVVVRLRQPGDLASVDPGALQLAPKARVVVETDRGEALATVLTQPRDLSANDITGRVLRCATPEDEQLRERNQTREAEAFRFCKDRIRSMHLGMKLVGVELALAGDRATFFFTSPQRVDFRALVKELARRFHTRIEMRQIGVRDAARFTGGIGICGRGFCCTTWLPGFEPVSIRMAKDQQLALNHDKLSGSCGRLRCCLRYEHQVYRQASTGLPKVGKRVDTPNGPGRVRDLDVLCQRVGVFLESGSAVVLPASEVSPLVPPQRQAQPAAPTKSPAHGPERSAAPSGDSNATAEAGGDDPQKPAGRKKRRRRRRRKRGGGGSPTEGGGPKEGGS